MAEVIYLSRTKKQWDEINEKLSKVGKTGLSSYITRKLSQLEKDYQTCPQCVCDLVSDKAKQKKITAPDNSIIHEIKKKTGKPLSVIIDRLIIDHL